MALIDMWREDRDGIRKKSVHQILTFAGEGRLADNNACSKEFRELLANVPLDVLHNYARETLTTEVTDSGLALQDIVNEVGARLGHNVISGLYRGRRGESGQDGLWLDESASHAIIAEVKSSSTYPIRLEIIAGYRDTLATAGKIIKENSSVLIIVGQVNDDTTGLEAQIRGSRYAWDVRLISLAALFKLVELKNATDDPASAQLLRDILRPREYTKLDSLLDIVSFVAHDISVETEEDLTEEEEAKKDEGAYVSQLDREGLLAEVKALLRKRLSLDFKVVSRSLLESTDRRIAICYAASKAYARGHKRFWFGLRDHQTEFMKSHPSGYTAYLCAGSGILIMPWTEFFKYARQMQETSDKTRHWRHVVLELAKDGKLKLRLKAEAPQNPVDVTKWFLKM